MSGDKHNPGEWRAGGYVGYGDIDGVRVYGAENYVLAVAIGDVPELNAEANARLIAAAPDLLEALKAAVFQLKAHKINCRERDEAIAAINKAEGRP